MTPNEYMEQGHTPHLKVFLESPAGRAFLEVIEDFGKPTNESRKQYGGAEDVKLQMSLNYVAMEQTFAVVKFIKGMVKPVNPQRVSRPAAPDLIDENASPEFLKERGIVIPDKIDFKKPAESPVTETATA